MKPEVPICVASIALAVALVGSIPTLTPASVALVGLFAAIITTMALACAIATTPSMRANKTRGAVLGLVAAAVVAGCEAYEPVRGCCDPMPWFVDGHSRLRALGLTFVAVMPFGIVIGTVLGALAEALSTILWVRVIGLVVASVTFSAFPLLLMPELVSYVMTASVVCAVVLAFVTTESSGPVPTAARGATPRACREAQQRIEIALAGGPQPQTRPAIEPI